MVRFKNRYVVLEVNPTKSPANSKLDMKVYVLQHAILAKLEQLHGDFGLAAVRSGFTIKYCNEYTRIAYVRIRHGPHKLLTSALPLVTKIGRTDVVLKTLYTGASLMQCNKFLEKHQKQQLQKLWPRLTTEEDRNFMKEAFLKLKS